MACPLVRCIHDQGNEFTANPFQHVLAINGIQDVPTTVANPQANAVNERLHQTVENILRTLLHAIRPLNNAHAITIIDTCFATARHAVRSAVHRTLNSSPGALDFQRDMILPIPLIADFELLRQRRQTVIEDNLRRQNLRRLFHDYNVGDEVLIVNRNPNRPTLAPVSTGSYVIQQVHVNGTALTDAPHLALTRHHDRRIAAGHNYWFVHVGFEFSLHEANPIVCW